ncbi:MAG: glutamate racemase [Bacilli bacterium]|jgi:glutamate racemase
MRDQPIGIFDSGIGGLTVLQNLIQQLPNESYIYIGDNKHCPYGDKPKEQLYKYACSIIDYFINHKVKLIVVACNTISSNVLPMLIDKYKDTKIIGIIESTTRLVLSSNTKKILVIATKATITSHIYKTSINKSNPHLIVNELMTPDLVPLIEKHLNDEIIVSIHQYLKPFSHSFDSILLGCTHYGIIKDIIAREIGSKKIINSSDGIVNEVGEYLALNNLKGSKKKIQVYTTGDVQDFISSSISFFDYKDINVQKLNLD